MGITMVGSSATAWSTLHEMYGSHTRKHSINTCITLATTRKVTATMADYFAKMKNYADDMAASGQPLNDEDFTAYVLIGLDEEFYNPLVSSIVTRVEPISLPELYSQMPWAPYPQHDRSNSSRGHGPGSGSPLSGSRGGFTNNSNFRCSTPSDQTGGQNHPKCQVCMKLGHTANIC
jgi:hypothetical protein